MPTCVPTNWTSASASSLNTAVLPIISRARPSRHQHTAAGPLWNRRRRAGPRARAASAAAAGVSREPAAGPRHVPRRADQRAARAIQSDAVAAELAAFRPQRQRAAQLATQLTTQLGKCASPARARRTAGLPPYPHPRPRPRPRPRPTAVSPLRRWRAVNYHTADTPASLPTHISIHATTAPHAPAPSCRAAPCSAVQRRAADDCCVDPAVPASTHCRSRAWTGRSTGRRRPTRLVPETIRPPTRRTCAWLLAEQAFAAVWRQPRRRAGRWPCCARGGWPRAARSTARVRTGGRRRLAVPGRPGCRHKRYPLAGAGV